MPTQHFNLQYVSFIFLAAASVLVGLAFADSPISSPYCLIACLVTTAVVLILSSILAATPCSYEPSWLEQKWRNIKAWFEQKWQNIKAWFYPRSEQSHTDMFHSQNVSASSGTSENWKSAADKLKEATDKYTKAKDDWKESSLLFDEANNNYDLMKDKWFQAQKDVATLSNDMKMAEEAMELKKDQLSKVGAHIGCCIDDVIQAKNAWNEANQKLSNIAEGDYDGLEKAQDDWNQARENLNQVVDRWSNANEDLGTSKENLDKTESILSQIRENRDKANEMLSKAKEKWNSSIDKMNKSKTSLLEASDELSYEFERAAEDSTKVNLPSLQNSSKKSYLPSTQQDSDVRATVPTKADSSPVKKICLLCPPKDEMECWDEIKKTAVVSVVATVFFFAALGMIFHYFPDQWNYLASLLRFS